MLKRIYVCYHENSRELAVDCGAMSDLLVTSKPQDVFRWIYDSIASGEENEYCPIDQDEKDVIYESIIRGTDGLLTLYNKGDENSSWNYDIRVKQYTLELGDITVVNEELIPRIQQMLENPDKAEKFVTTLIEQIKSDEDPRESRGYNMARALLENSLDSFLIALCGWGTKSFLNIAEFGSAYPVKSQDNKGDSI